MEDDGRSTLKTLIGTLLIALTVALPAMDLEVFRVGGKSIVLPYLLLMALAAVVAAYPGALRRQLSDGVGLFLSLWIFAAACSGVLAFMRTQNSSFLAANLLQLAMVIFMAAHYIVIGAALRLQSDPELLRVRNAFVLTACAGALLTFYQFASVMWGLPYTEWLRTSNLYYKANTLNMHGGGSWISFPRPFGSAPEPTFWAGYLIVSLAFVAGKWHKRPKPRILIETGLIAGALLLTFSRSALPALIAMVLAGVIARWFSSRWLVPAIVAAVLGITIAPVFVDEPWLTLMSDRSALERVSAHLTGIRMVADYPVLGIGPGSTSLLMDRYAVTLGNRTDIAFVYFYSFILNVIVTTGIIGTIFFSGFLLQAGRDVHRGMSSTVSREIRGVQLSCLMAFAAILVYWVSSPAYNMSFLWFALAFGSASTRRDLSGTEWRASAST
jgi:hypothetical protein